LAILVERFTPLRYGFSKENSKEIVIQALVVARLTACG
jgi:hypothetical protein